MKRIKILFTLLLALSVALGVAACGEDPGTTGSDFPATGSTQIQVTDSQISEPEPEPEPYIPPYINPLTGLRTEYDTNATRPLGVMINNIQQSLPQVGVGKADILIECLAEGNITRLLGIYAEYQQLDVVGSVRSSRPYYLDFAQMFDAIYCHAGGSEDAYAQIAARKINNIDGVRKDPTRAFYRDPERLQTMDLEHTMMTTGANITNAIAHFGYRTALREDRVLPFSFPEEGTSVTVGTESATHIYLPISGYQTVDYVYDPENLQYLRYQYNGRPHIDAADGSQLAFKNVIVLFCRTYAYDDYGRLKVDTVGTGNGILISEGKSAPITWTREHQDGNLTLLDEAQNPIVINRGKTAINVCPLLVAEKINLNAADRTMNS